MEIYQNNYKGIIIQNNDPEKMGRVKVWVPQINASLYDKWNNDKEHDKSFTYFGKNLKSSLTPVLLDRLKEILPWATVKHPVFGMGSSITYNADIDYADNTNNSYQSNQLTDINLTTSETKNTNSLLNELQGTKYVTPDIGTNNRPTQNTVQTISNPFFNSSSNNGSTSSSGGNNPSGVTMPPTVISKPSFNKGGTGAEIYNLTDTTLLSPEGLINCIIGGVNTMSKQYINYSLPFDNEVDPNITVKSNLQTVACTLPPMLSNTQGNKVKGMLSIPNVGTHVSVYFDNGDPLYPIVDGYFYTQEDFLGIHDVI
jgi:hypothetical protein